jgi:hypothetical protein
LGAQTKLRISPPGDLYEQEADRAAAQVVAGRPSGPISTVAGGVPQRSTAEAGATQSGIDQTPVVRAGVADPALVPASGGRPLDAGTRASMEAGLGHDFSRVRIHDGPRAATSARSLAARAYTVGERIVFGAGQLDTASRAGRQLLAHELVHTVQQRQAPPIVQRAPARTGKAEPHKGTVIKLIVDQRNTTAVFVLRLPDSKEERLVVHYLRTRLPAGKTFTGVGTNIGFSVSEKLPVASKSERAVITFGAEAAALVRARATFPESFPIQVVGKDEEADPTLGAGGSAERPTGGGGGERVAAPTPGAEPAPGALEGIEGGEGANVTQAKDGAGEPGDGIEGGTGKRAVPKGSVVDAAKEAAAAGSQSEISALGAAVLTLKGSSEPSRFLKAGEITVKGMDQAELVSETTRVARSALLHCYEGEAVRVEGILAGDGKRQMEVQVPQVKALRRGRIDKITVVADIGRIEPYVSEKSGGELVAACDPDAAFIKIPVDSTEQALIVKTAVELGEEIFPGGAVIGALKKQGRKRISRAARKRLGKIRRAKRRARRTDAGEQARDAKGKFRERKPGESGPGKPFERTVRNKLEKNYDHVEEQIKVFPLDEHGNKAYPSITVDFMCKKGGKIDLFEAKAFEPRVPSQLRQRFAIEKLRKYGGFVSSKKSDVFTEGMKIAPTDVKVLTPSKVDAL